MLNVTEIRSGRQVLGPESPCKAKPSGMTAFPSSPVRGGKLVTLRTPRTGRPKAGGPGVNEDDAQKGVNEAGGGVDGEVGGGQSLMLLEQVALDLESERVCVHTHPLAHNLRSQS